MADNPSLYSPVAMALLRANLGFYDSTLPTAVETDLQHLLTYAYHALAKASVFLNIGEMYDDELQAMYAAWLYRKRITGEAKPPMVQAAIREYQIANAMEERL